MESSSNNNLKTKKILEKDVALSAFRKIRKMIILFFVIFLICLSLIIADLIIYLAQNTHSESDYESIPLNPAIQTFYSAANCRTNPCLDTFNCTISSGSAKTIFITNSNQILTLALQTAYIHLEDIIAASSIRDTNYNNTTHEFCSNSLYDSLSRTGDVLATMGVNPFVEYLSGDLRSEMVNRIAAVQGNLKLCLGDLEKVADDRSTAVIELRAMVREVEVYVNCSREFLMIYTEEFLRWRKMGFDNSG